MCIILSLKELKLLDGIELHRKSRRMWAKSEYIWLYFPYAPFFFPFYNIATLTLFKAQKQKYIACVTLLDQWPLENH